MAQKKKTAKRGILGAHRILGRSFGFIRTHRKQYLLITLISIAVNLIIQFALSDEAATLYQGIWFIFISGAFIWFIRHSNEPKLIGKLSNAFYQGTGPSLKLILSLTLLALSSIPFSLGAFIFSTVQAVAAGSTAALIISGAVWAILALVTLVLLARLIFALIIVTLPELRPLESFRISWGLTKGITKTVVARLGVFLAYTVILALGLVLLLSLVPLNNTIAEVLVEIFASGIVLPLFYVFLFYLYQEIQ